MNEPSIKIGTVLPIGKVVEIHNDHCVVILQGKRGRVSFADVEASLKGESND